MVPPSLTHNFTTPLVVFFQSAQVDVPLLKGVVEVVGSDDPEYHCQLNELKEVTAEVDI
jgi:hypothetical protein